VKTWKFIEQYIFSFWKSYILLLHTNSKWSREQKQCCAHEWGVQINLAEAQMCKDELKRNLSLSITLNHNPRRNISSLYDIFINLLHNNAIWHLTLSLSSIYKQSTVGCTYVFFPVTHQASNQLGTPGRAKVFLRGTHIF